MALVVVHCIHFLTIVPMLEGIATEHGCEVLSHTLERLLGRSAVASKSPGHIQTFWWSIADAWTSPELQCCYQSKPWPYLDLLVGHRRRFMPCHTSGQCKPPATSYSNKHATFLSEASPTILPKFVVPTWMPLASITRKKLMCKRTVWQSCV